MTPSSLPKDLQRLIGAGSGGLVDRVDDVDVRIALQQVLHRRAAALRVARGHVVADDARIVLVADLVGILGVDAEACHEALVAQHVDRRLRRAEIEQRDLGVRRLVAQLRRGPLADQPAGLEVVGGEGGVGGVGRVERGVERDHQNALVARLLQHVDDRLGVGRR